MILWTTGKNILECPSARFDPLDGLRVVKTCLFNDSLELGVKKSHTEQDHINREFVPVRRCSSQPETVGYSSRYEQVRL